ncbi:MAG: CNP1-like family protein [Burkholderiaceae bacterium]
MPKQKFLIILTMQFALSISTHAQSRFEQDFDDADKPWQEIATQLPAIPLEENLIPFYVSATATLKFAIDSKSLTVGSDGVIRYVLVSKSASGAENVSYEGIRCESSEVKLYAFGHKDGTWGKSRRDKWEPILEKASNRQHAALARDYFCNNKIAAGGAQEILDRMKYRRPFTQYLNVN